MQSFVNLAKIKTLILTLIKYFEKKKKNMVEWTKDIVALETGHYIM